jgi:hypothetical protein
MIRIDDDTIIKVCSESKTMAEAARTLSINYKTLRSHAIRLGCLVTNQCGKGITRKVDKIPLIDIFGGKPYQSHKLKLRLIEEGYKQAICESCDLDAWINVSIPLELHHVDGNPNNNSLDNLQLLCPNCHALTENYRAKNIKTRMVE